MPQAITNQHVQATRASPRSSSYLQADLGPGAAVFFVATSRRIASAYPSGHSRGSRGVTH